MVDFRYFVECLDGLLTESGISRNKMLTDLQIAKNSFNNWAKRGTIPSGDVIVKIADYFNVSTDYLLGKTDIKTPLDEQRLFVRSLINYIEIDGKRLDIHWRI